MTLDDRAHALVQAAHHAEDEWLTVKEYAALKRVGEETVRLWIRRGKVQAERTIEPHGHWRIRAPRRASA